MNYPIYCSFYRAIFFTLLFLPGILFSQWVLQSTGSQYPLRDIYFINSNTGFVVSNSNQSSNLMGGEIYRTTSGGSLWQRVLLDSNFRGKDFYFLNENTGFVVGGRFSEEGFIYKTTNTGLNWSNVTPPLQINCALNNITFVNSLTGFVSGITTVYKTTDAGNSWAVSIFINQNSPAAKVFFSNETTGYYVHDTNAVYKTINSGLYWQYYIVPASPIVGYLRDIKFINENTGFVIGDSARIYKSVNQGVTWSREQVPITQHLFSINFVNSFTGYITAEHTVLKTTNSGTSFFTIFNQTADSIFSSFFLNPDTGYICCDDGRVYKTTTGGVIGINNVSTEIPESFYLFQNYPNPFNPSTKIKFAVPKASVVRLSVYDALGREIETLVNESLQPGTYEVNWIAEKFSSGIYFYKLLTSDFSMVKKLSLIK